MQGHCERCVWGCILVQASGRSWLPRTVLRPRWDLEVPIRSSPVLCKEGTAWSCCPHCRGLCAGRPVCQERVGMTALCVRQACSRHVQGSRGCGGRSVRKDGKTALAPAAVATKRLPLSWPATQRPLLRGLPAQRHRSASLVEEEPASREAPQQHIAASRSAALVTMLHPYDKEPQQPVAELPM